MPVTRHPSSPIVEPDQPAPRTFLDEMRRTAIYIQLRTQSNVRAGEAGLIELERTARVMVQKCRIRTANRETR